jgi:hypothetical protein
LSKKEDAECEAKGIAMNATDRLVLDSSIALAWCFADQKNAYADAIAALFPTIEATVPTLWPLEIGNILVVGERRGRNTQADTVQWTRFPGSLPIVIDDQTTAQAWRAKPTSSTSSLSRSRTARSSTSNNIQCFFVD